MSDFDVFDDDHLPADRLLNELESIKVLLDDNDDDAIDASLTDIPLLDDMVIGNLDTNTRLLNLNRIFGEENDEQSAEHSDNLVDDLELEPIAPPKTLAARVDIPFPRFTLDTMLSDDVSELTVPVQPTVVPAPSTPHSPQLKSPITGARVRPDYSRDVLIQELVDEFVPQIEAALRERLSQLDDATLQQWKDPE